MAHLIEATHRTSRLASPAAVKAPSSPTLSRDYVKNFSAWLGSGGHRETASMYEGADTAGGFAVPVTVSEQIVQLAPVDSAVRRLATVITTTDTVKFPIVAARGAAAIKAESGASQNVFGGASPTIGQFTLGAYVVGVENQVSIEFARDVTGFLTFLSQDAALDIEALEDSLFISGSGVGQPQGLLGNVGAGITGVLAGSDNYASELLTATFDVLAELKAIYHAGASWLMARGTARDLRKAARANNDPVFTREEGKEYFHGFPLELCEAMPAIAAGATPILFGNFSLGYLIGDRGSSGVSVKILDQMLALQGQLQFLAYRRTDGRVRRSEAIQGITLHS